MSRAAAFGLESGQIIAEKYEILDLLGAGWEGEVYRIRECSTGIERAAKLFFPQRNRANRTATAYARRLHHLRHCPVVIQYHGEEILDIDGQCITALISEFVEGELLSKFIARQPGKRLHPFQALHLLHALVQGVECIHANGEYHGDMHVDNVIIESHALQFALKLPDLFLHQGPRRENMQHDIIECIRIFYDALGGARCYARQPQIVKDVCLGLKRGLIIKRFPSAARLRSHLENMQW